MSKEIFLSGIIGSMKINNYILKQKTCAVFIHAQAEMLFAPERALKIFCHIFVLYF